MAYQEGLGAVLERLVGNPELMKLFRRPEKVEIFCTTLRDGGQNPNFTWTMADKIFLTQLLVEAGIKHIEVGWPVPGDQINPDTVRQLAADRTYWQKGVTFYAFGSTDRADKTIWSESPLIRCLLATGAKNFVIFGKSWTLHVDEVLRIGREDNLRIIRETIRILYDHGGRVIYDAEHSVSGWLADREYFFKTLKAAIGGGAQRIVFCDTLGGSMQSTWISFLLDVVPWVNKKGIPWGVHVHNDTELAVANTLLAVEMGCDHIQGTVGGIGERVGNASLSSIVPALQLKMGIKVVSDEELKQWTGLARQVYEIAGQETPANLPWVGENAFTHKAGTHVDAFLKNPEAVNHIDPVLVGNRVNIGVSNQSGRATIWEWLKKIAPRIAKKDPRVGEILKKVNRLEAEGWLFESAMASFNLLALDYLGLLKPTFKVARCELREDLPPFDGLFDDEQATSYYKRLTGELPCIATVRVKLADGTIPGLKSAGGVGLLNAVDTALRKALQERGGQKRPAAHPQLKHLRLVGYQVKALIKKDNTAASVRVTLMWRSNGGDIWGTCYVSHSVLEASVKALVAGFHYFLDSCNRT
jgi:2-isopropylmalate synthase